MFRNKMKDMKNAKKYRKAAAHLEAEEYEEAIELCNELIEDDFIGFCYGYGIRGASYHDLGMYDKAIEDATKAIEKGFYFSYGIRASCYHNLGMYDEAIADVTNAFKFEVGDVDDIYVRGYSYFEIGKYDEALEDIKAYLSADEYETTDVGICIFLYYSALIHNHKGDLETVASNIEIFFQVLGIFKDSDGYSDIVRAMQVAINNMKEMQKAINEGVPYISFPEEGTSAGKKGSKSERSLGKVISINMTKI